MIKGFNRIRLDQFYDKKLAYHEQNIYNLLIHSHRWKLSNLNLHWSVNNWACLDQFPDSEGKSFEKAVLIIESNDFLKQLNFQEASNQFPPFKDSNARGWLYYFLFKEVH